jgi:hypothetical protein
MTTTTQRDSPEAQSIKTENLARELRELADNLVAKAQQLFESTCHPALGDFSGELQQDRERAEGRRPPRPRPGRELRPPSA